MSKHAALDWMSPDAKRWCAARLPGFIYWIGEPAEQLLAIWGATSRAMQLCGLYKAIKPCQDAEVSWKDHGFQPFCAIVGEPIAFAATLMTLM